MQLVLAISVSSGSVTAGELDAETAQIKAAKQRSLGCSPDESVFEYLSLRYWLVWLVNCGLCIIECVICWNPRFDPFEVISNVRLFGVCFFSFGGCKVEE
ncbi:hypothetical protein Hanom_Chr00s041131g01774451 [Helianthus anomalus]